MLERICVILLLNLCFFLKTLGYKYVSDDIPVLQRPKNWRNKWEKAWFWVEGCIRTTPQADHFLTIIIHSLVSVFIYTGFGASDISFWAAILFSVNPINNQCTAWVSGRGYALSALGMTAAMTFPWVGPIILILATYSNAGFLSPIVFIGSKLSWFLLFLPAIWWFHWGRFKSNVVAKIKMEMYDADREIHPKKLILAIKTFGFYTVHALIPIKTTFYHSYMQSMAGSGKERAYSFKDRFLWIGLVIVVSILWYWVKVPWNIVSFGLLWWCICLAPFLNLFRLNQEIAERYTYLPLAGLMIVLSSVLINYPIFMWFFIGMYATKLWFYMDCFQDDYYLVEAACLNSPGSWFAWHVRGMKRWDCKSFQEAVILWTMARMLSPNEFKVLFNLATALKLSKNDKEALEFLRLAENNIPFGQEEQTKKLLDDWKNGNVSIIL